MKCFSIVLFALLVTLVKGKGRIKTLIHPHKSVKKISQKSDLLGFFDSFSMEESVRDRNESTSTNQRTRKNNNNVFNLVRRKSQVSSSDSFNIDKNKPREHHVKGERYLELRMNSLDELKEHYRKYGKVDLAQEVGEIKSDIQTASKRDLEFAKHFEKTVDFYLQYIGDLDRWNDDVRYNRMDLSTYKIPPFHKDLPLSMPVTDEYYSHRKRTTVRS